MILVVIKDILLCLLGFRFIYNSLAIFVDIIYKTLQMCYYHQHVCLLVCLSVSQTSMMIQVTKEIRGDS